MRLPKGVKTVRLAVRAYRIAGQPPRGAPGTGNPLAEAVWMSQAPPIPARSLRRVWELCQVLAGDRRKYRIQHRADWLAQQARREILHRPGVSEPSNIVVVFVDGDTPPKLCGHGWHYRTKGGTVIRHPSAYSRCGWSNMQYCASDRRIEVGIHWRPA